MLLRGGYDEKSWEMACNWLMMTSSGDNNGRVGVWVCSPTKLKEIRKAEQETAQPTAVQFNKLKAKQETAHKNTTKYLATTFCEKTLPRNNFKDG